MLATGQEACKPAIRNTRISFPNSPLQCTDLSFSLVLWCKILVLGTRNSTNCRRCDSVQHTFIEHILRLRGRKWKSGLCSQEACRLMGDTDLYVTSCKWVLTEVKAKCTEKEKASWRRWHLSLRVHQLATGRSRCVCGRLCRLRHHSREKGLMAIWGQEYRAWREECFCPGFWSWLGLDCHTKGLEIYPKENAEASKISPLLFQDQECIWRRVSLCSQGRKRTRVIHVPFYFLSPPFLW